MAIRDMVKTIRVNNKVALFLQNTVIYNVGLGNKTKKTFAKGDGEVEQVTAVDVSTKLGMVKFTAPNDSQSREDAIEWATNDTNSVQLIFESGKILTYSAMVLDSPDLGGGSDTDIEINFEGSPAK